MAIVVGLDIGTTTLSAVAVDATTGAVAASATMANDAKAASYCEAGGRSEWDIERMTALSTAALRECADRLGERRREVAGLCVTGQQHGVVVVDDELRPLTPYINWQDRRGEEPHPEGGTWVERARDLLGREAVERAGCRLANGYMGTTLWWLKENGHLPEDGATACFGPEYAAASMTGERAVTDPTMGASSGLFDLRARAWDDAAIARLGLPRGIFPDVREAGDTLGRLTSEAAEATRLPEGAPVCVGLGDNQASFLGSVADLRGTVLVNVGTGGQVACLVDEIKRGSEVETRPFARGGYLLVFAGLSGGRAYALLEKLFRSVGEEVLGVEVGGKVYGRMNALAEQVSPGCDGMRCDPSFAGSRWAPERRGRWTGVSESNLTPGHLARSLLEGTARVMREGYGKLLEAGAGERRALVGAGNGVRENALLARMIADEFGMPMRVPAHREEAAYGAALVAGYAVGVWDSVEAAARATTYE